MKYNIKLCLEPYKICCAFLYFVILSLIRGVSYMDEIGAAMDVSAALLAIVFCAETYCMEINEKRREIFMLYEKRRQSRTIRQRILIQIVFLCVAAYGGYFCFFWQRPVSKGELPFYELYGSYMIAVTATLLFFGLLSMTISNVTGNQWCGIGICTLFWLLISSKAGQELLGNLNIFAYGSDSGGLDWEWMPGKAVGFLLAVLMIGLIPYTLKNSVA